MVLNDQKNPEKANVISIFGLNFFNNKKKQKRKNNNQGANKLLTEYDTQGNLTKIENHKGEITQYFYDDKSQLCKVKYPDGTYSQYRYDENGRIVEKVKRDGSWIHYEYSGNLIQTITHSDESRVKFFHNMVNRLTKLSTAEITTEYDYDSQNRILRQKDIINNRIFTTRYRYNTKGDLIGILAPGSNHWLIYQYDEKRRLNGLTMGNAYIDKQVTSDDSQVKMSYSNGINCSFKLSPGNKLNQIRVNRDDTILENFNYSVNTKGLIVKQNQIKYTYDSDQRLIKANDGNGLDVQFQYDAEGNILSHNNGKASFTTDYVDQLLRYSSVDDQVICRYDANGNLIEKQGRSLRIEYGYDGFDRLIFVKRNGQTQAEYRYNGRGLRVYKKTSNEETYYHYDYHGSLIGKTVNDKKIFYLVVNGAVWGHIECDSGKERICYYHSDHLGSVRLITDEHGEVIQQTNFSPFGVFESDGDIIFYQGKEWDSESGCYYFGARFYDPNQCRFITPDSHSFLPDDERLLHLPNKTNQIIQSKQKIIRTWLKQVQRCESRYAFCANNPISFVDVDGHSAWGYFGYTILALIWSVPYTVNAFLFFEVIVNWVFYYILTFAWLWDKTHKWEGSSSDRLSTWAWDIIGGFSGKMVIGGAAFTQGNIVIYNSDFYNNLNDTLTNFTPLEYPTVNITEKEAATEHELRHVAQFAWFGPFMMPWVLVLGFLLYNGILTLIPRNEFEVNWRNLIDHIGDHLWELAFIPLLPGAYWWDYIVKWGYSDSSFEQDAARHSGYAVNIDIPPLTPTLISPADASTPAVNPPTFDWSNVRDAVAYQIQVDNNNTFPSPLIDQASLTASSFTPTSALSTGTYFWRARAQNGFGTWSDWSNIWSIIIP